LVGVEVIEGVVVVDDVVAVGFGDVYGDFGLL